jgi:hypothetical protein
MTNIYIYVQHTFSVKETKRCNLVNSFWEVHNCVAPFTSQGKLQEFGAETLIF